MTLRLALTDEVRDERSVTVSAAAVRLGCDQTTVRALLRLGLLAGHRIGKTAEPNGVRIKLWSIEAWEEKHAIGGTTDLQAGAKAAPRRRRHGNPADAEADAFLKALGA